MSTYQKKLKRSKNGIVRYVGRNFAGHREKFYLGWDLQVAEQREALIRELWGHLERHWHFTQGNFYWTPDYLAAAKAIAKGKPPVLPPTFKMKSDPERYVEALNQISSEFTPADVALYETGVERVSEEIRHRRTTLSERGNVELTGQLIDDALDAFRDHLHTKSLQPCGSLKPWGSTQLNQLKSWRRYMAESSFFIKDGQKQQRELLRVDLAHLSQAHCQEMIDAVRLRPLSFESERRKNGRRTRLTESSASGIIKVAMKFFDWLDLSDDFDWFEPRKFRLTRKPITLTSSEMFVRDQKKEASTLPYEHIELLSKYALPSERVILLCGLNAAFGPGEIGQLRIPFIRSETAEIVGIRFKTGNPTRHRLWPETLKGLQWQLEEQKKIKPSEEEFRDMVFLSARGTPLWQKTRAGNYSDGVGRRWDRLVKRVQKDHPKFPSYSLGKLRKTAATRILYLDNAEAASLILAHKTLSEDDLLHHYVQIPWEKLYQAQEKFGREIAPYLKLDRPAFVRQPKNYIGLKKIELIRELDEADVPVAQIAKAAKVSAMTVYRQLKRMAEETIGIETPSDDFDDRD